MTFPEIYLLARLILTGKRVSYLSQRGQRGILFSKVEETERTPRKKTAHMVRAE